MSDPHQASVPNSADDQLACDFVLGLLHGGDLASVHQRVIADAAFAALVAGWRQRLSATPPDLPPVQPRPALWDNISARTQK